MQEVIYRGIHKEIFKIIRDRVKVLDKIAEKEYVEITHFYTDVHKKP